MNNLPFLSSTWLPLSAIVARLAAAVALGAIIGFEREWRQQPAGLRTHILVCLAAATAAIVTVEITHMSVFGAESVRVDPIRLVEAVTAGVAFLAAGLIVFAKGHIHGLTTGAGIWLVGVVGLATGLGIWSVAGIATILGLIVLWLLRWMEEKLLPTNGEAQIARDEKDRAAD
jgi:putative Mg2+ transporter-C (MgtC) family protein